MTSSAKAAKSADVQDERLCSSKTDVCGMTAFALPNIHCTLWSPQLFWGLQCRTAATEGSCTRRLAGSMKQTVRRSAM